MVSRQLSGRAIPVCDGTVVTRYIPRHPIIRLSALNLNNGRDLDRFGIDSAFSTQLPTT